MSIGTTVAKPTVAIETAVARFLKHMNTAARKTFPSWEKTLTEGIDDCALNYDTRYALLEVHPLDDYYFAGVVALEAAKIRRLFPPRQASALLSEIADHVDDAAERKDRVVSDLVFFIIGHLEQITSDPQKMPHDQVVKVILQKLGFEQAEAARHLMNAILYRHTLGEPLALGVPRWWELFHSKYALTTDEAPSPPQPATEASTVPPPPTRRIPRRAAALI